MIHSAWKNLDQVAFNWPHNLDDRQAHADQHRDAVLIREMKRRPDRRGQASTITNSAHTLDRYQRAPPE